MRKKVLLTTIVAFVILVAAVAAGLNAIFTVTYVRLEFQPYTEQGSADAQSLREDLDTFIGKSTAFLDLDDVAAVVEKYPCMRLDLIEKANPTTIRLAITERRETFAAVREEGGYAILDEVGTYLYDKETAKNRSAGENILLEDFHFTVSEGHVSGSYLPALLEMAAAFQETFGEIRANILSITLVQPTSNVRSDFFRLRMQEGVVIDIAKPSEGMREKSAAAIARYLTLSDEERTFGFITAFDGAEGAETDYTRNSRLS
ncbi:MAG: hypothetical protein IKD43_03925 [Clostridia bacterium]|nr:hypothetical protein [Clostridia bacterium]